MTRYNMFLRAFLAEICKKRRTKHTQTVKPTFHSSFLFPGLHERCVDLVVAHAHENFMAYSFFDGVLGNKTGWN